ncbi:MAG TPA: class I SAM-dependent methyltransferase [Solirubrobacteraceae bacterium]|nr:class I SAM-dependent methyltransferase [Solirubrobacteraceae bacterium]
MDWGIGSYERTAVELAPAARAAIDAAAPREGEHVVDVGCGAGNAALLAAARGARVTGVDPAPRLLDVARAEASARGLNVAFLEGDAASLPLPDGSANVVVSVFGAIFAPDASAAAAEMTRVTAPSGRMVLCAWIPGGALWEIMRARRELMAAASHAPPGPLPFAWHEQAALDGLFTPLGFDVELSQHQLAFTASSPREFLESELRNHPLWLAARATLEPGGEMDTMRARALEIYEHANEDADGFRLTSSYVVARISQMKCSVPEVA